MTSRVTCEQWRLRSCIPSNDVKSTKNKDQTRFVTFSNAVKVVKIPSCREFSLQEATDYWFAEEEYASTEHKMRKEIAMMEKGKTLHDKKYCSRGLEQYLKKNSIPRAANIQQGVSAVLKAQHDLRQTTLRNFELEDIRIAKAYQGVSSSCHMWAAVIGLRDTRTAEKYLEDILECPSEYPCKINAELLSQRSICIAKNRQTPKALFRHELVPRTA
eukprot:scaffold11725_cov116-Cylindrotheca_fusiformis.AAC.12